MRTYSPSSKIAALPAFICLFAVLFLTACNKSQVLADSDSNNVEQWAGKFIFIENQGREPVSYSFSFTSDGLSETYVNMDTDKGFFYLGEITEKTLQGLNERDYYYRRDHYSTDFPVRAKDFTKEFYFGDDLLFTVKAQGLAPRRYTKEQILAPGGFKDDLIVVFTEYNEAAVSAELNIVINPNAGTLEHYGKLRGENAIQ